MTLDGMKKRTSEDASEKMVTEIDATYVSIIHFSVFKCHIKIDTQAKENADK